MFIMLLILDRESTLFYTTYRNTPSQQVTDSLKHSLGANNQPSLKLLRYQVPFFSVWYMKHRWVLFYIVVVFLSLTGWRISMANSRMNMPAIMLCLLIIPLITLCSAMNKGPSGTLESNWKQCVFKNLNEQRTLDWSR